MHKEPLESANENELNGHLAHFLTLTTHHTPNCVKVSMTLCRHVSRLQHFMRVPRSINHYDIAGVDRHLRIMCRHDQDLITEPSSCNISEGAPPLDVGKILLCTHRFNTLGLAAHNPYMAATEYTITDPTTGCRRWD